jgi:competence protein ComEC
MQNKVFYAACFGFLLGVLLRSFVLIDFYLITLFVFLSFFVMLLFMVLKNNWGMIGGLFILMLSFGAMRFSLNDIPPPQDLEAQVGARVTLNGYVTEEPEVKASGEKLIMIIQKGVYVLVNAGSAGVDYGDKIAVTGKLERPENFLTDQGKVFDYINYLRKDGILYTISFPKIKIISRGNGSPLQANLFKLKQKFIERVNYAIAPPESTLMGGLILGEKSSFDESLRKSFIDTGTIHMVALSGYNVTIVADWVMKFFSFLSAAMSFYLGIITIILFILMTGSTSTAIRAGIMAVLALFARQTGRNYDAGRILVLAAAGMVFFNPLLLVYDVSFQLSFIATVAVIFVAPRIEKYFQKVPEQFGMRDIVSVTSAAYLFVAPFILYKMGSLSLVAIPANILILPLVPLTMLFGFITGFLGLIWKFLAIPFGYLSYILLQYELSIVKIFSKFSFAALTIPNFPLIITVAIYAYFLYKLFGRSIKQFFTTELS